MLSSLGRPGGRTFQSSAESPARGPEWCGRPVSGILGGEGTKKKKEAQSTFLLHPSLLGLNPEAEVP